MREVQRLQNALGSVVQPNEPFGNVSVCFMQMEVSCDWRVMSGWNEEEKNSGDVLLRTKYIPLGCLEKKCCAAILYLLW